MPKASLQAPLVEHMNSRDSQEAQPLTLASVPRTASMERGLMASAPPSGTVASSLDDEQVCRICLESTNNADPFSPERLIAPCQCRGTSAWVHRGCLDRWRATQEDRAFSQCTECTFGYEYVQRADDDETAGWLFEDGPLTAKRRRKLKFQMYVTRDFLFVFIALQLCVCFMAGLVRKMDCGKWTGCIGYDPEQTFNMSHWGDGGNYHDDAAECCPDGFIVNALPPFSLLKNHTQSAYYLAGLILFFASVGLIGCCNKRVPGCDCCSDTNCNCCDGCNNYYWWNCNTGSSGNDCDCCCCCDNRGGGGRHHHVIHSGGGGGGGSGDCDCCPGNGDCKPSGGGGSGDGGELVAILFAILLILIVVFAVIGVMEGIFFISIIMQRSMQSHVHMLQKASLAEQFVVEDLCGTDGCRSVTQVLQDRATGAATMPSAPPAGAVGSDMERGEAGGLMRTTTAGGRSVMEREKARAAMKALAL